MSHIWEAGLNRTTNPSGTPSRACARRRSISSVPGLWAFVLCLAGFCEPSWGTIAFVQVANTTLNTSNTSVTINYASAQSAGDLNVVIVGWEVATSDVSSVTDTKGNTYTLAVGPTRDTSQSVSIYYAKNIAAATAGANTVTVTFNASVFGADVRIAEYSGIDTSAPFDVANGASGSGTALSSGSMTTTTANEVIVGGNVLANSTTAVGSGFTSRVQTTHGHILEDRIVTATGSYAATATQGPSGIWAMVGATFRAAGTGDTQAPAAPTGLTATAVSSSQINLSWTASTDNVGVTGYLVERCQGASCSTFAQIATPTTTSYSDTGLTASTSYSYRVRAKDAANNLGSYSSTASATTQAAGDVVAPSAPSNLLVVAASSSEIDLAWTASTDNVGVTGYLIERCQGASCSSFAQVGTSAVTTFNDGGRSAGTSYSYRVRATDAANNPSSYSNTVSQTTPASSPDCDQ